MSNLKKEHRALFLSMQADAKGFPGGICGLAEHLHRHRGTFANQLNPDHDAAPPSLDAMVELIKLTNGKRTVFALAQLVGQVPMDIELEHHSRADAVKMFMALIHESSKVFGIGSEFASDLEFDADERKKLEPLLMNLLKATAEFIQSLRG